MSLKAHRTELLGMIEWSTVFTDLHIWMIRILTRLYEVLVFNDCFAVVTLEAVVAFENERSLRTGLSRCKDAVFMNYVPALDAAYHFFSIFEPQTISAFFTVRTCPRDWLGQTAICRRRIGWNQLLETVFVIYFVTISTLQAFEYRQSIVTQRTS